MFSVIYNKYFHRRDYHGYAHLAWTVTFAIFFFFIVPPIIITESVSGASGTIATPPVVAIAMMSFLVLSVLIIIIPQYDSIINKLINFISDGDINKPHLIGSMLFGKRYASDIEYRHKENYHRHSAIVACIIIPIQVIIVVFSIPVLIPWALGFALVVGLGTGLLFTARKAYRISKQLTEHVNDKSVHNEKANE